MSDNEEIEHLSEQLKNLRLRETKLKKEIARVQEQQERISKRIKNKNTSKHLTVGDEVEYAPPEVRRFVPGSPRNLEAFVTNVGPQWVYIEPKNGSKPTKRYHKNVRKL